MDDLSFPSFSQIETTGHPDAEMVALQSLISALALPTEITTFAQTAVDYCTQILGYQAAAVFIDQGAATLSLLALAWQNADIPHIQPKQPNLPTLSDVPTTPAQHRVALFRQIQAQHPHLSPIRKSWCWPLRDKQQIIGLLAFGLDDSEVTPPSSRSSLAILAQLLQLAHHYTQVSQRESHERQRYDALRESLALLVSSLNLDETLARILESLASFIEFDSAAIYLLTPNNRLRMVSSWGMPAQEMTMAASAEVDRFPLDEAVISNRTLLAVDDVRQDRRWTPLAGTEYIRSWLGVPLIYHDEIIGLVTLDRSEVRPFPPDEMMLAEAFARHAGIAIGNARLFSQVQTQQLQLKRLSGRVVDALEDERRRISRELHDEMGQALTAIKLHLQMLSLGLPPTDETTSTHLQEIIQLASHSLQEVRRLAMDLRPSMLDDLGLEPTLRWYQTQFEKRSQTQVNLEIDADFPRLTPTAETALYRVVQEALTNVSRHAQASRVDIQLAWEENAITCSIIDNGQGFALDSKPGQGIGLASMRERIEALAGNITITSQPQAGTQITIRLPSETIVPPTHIDLEMEEPS